MNPLTCLNIPLCQIKFSVTGEIEQLSRDRVCFQLLISLPTLSPEGKQKASLIVLRLDNKGFQNEVGNFSL